MGLGTLKMDNAVGSLVTVSTEAVMEADLAFTGQTISNKPIANTWGQVRVAERNAVLAFRGFHTLVMDSLAWNALYTTRTYEFTQSDGATFSFEGMLISYTPNIPFGSFNGWQATVVSQGEVTRVSPFISGLTAYYSLEEASGTRVAAHGGNNLTDNNTVTQDTGIVGKCASFARASTEYLSCVDNAALKFGAGVAADVDCWVKLASKASPEMTFVSKNGALAANYEYSLNYSAALDRFQVYLHNGTSLLTLVANTFGVPSTGVWYYLRFGWNPATNLAFIQVNNGTMDTAAMTGGIQALTNAFAIGAQSTSGQPHDGLIDEVGIWKRIRSATEVTTRFNNGSPIMSYPF